MLTWALLLVTIKGSAIATVPGYHTYAACKQGGEQAVTSSSTPQQANTKARGLRLSTRAFLDRALHA